MLRGRSGIWVASSMARDARKRLELAVVEGLR